MPDLPDSSAKATRPNATKEAMATVRADASLSRQLYQAFMGTVFLVVGLFVTYNDHYSVAVSVSIGLIIVAVGLVLAILALVRGTRMIREKHYPRIALATMIFVVVVPIAVWILAATTHK